MYRYSVDQTIVYTSEDFVLFRESPFACWMERLSLENPEHAISPDFGSKPACEVLTSEDELAATLLEDGKDVVLVDWQADESERRNATLSAMRHGVDFIVNGQLAVGPLSSCANLLMRTSGYSELGNYLYIPCDTQDKTTLNSAFRLCFLADMLHSLQGQLPPQMLILRGNSEVLPLQTDDHIYHYRAVKQRFMTAQREFRKHRMPDPVEASHFGRWSECANEVMKQRALGHSGMSNLLPDDERAEPDEISTDVHGSVYDLHEEVGMAAIFPSAGAGTLAEQARLLTSQSAASGIELEEGAELQGSGNHLEQLKFIGSGKPVSTTGIPEKKFETTATHQFRSPPPAKLRDSDTIDRDVCAAPTAVEEKNINMTLSSSLITNRAVED
jgi:hypothetical protein